MENDDGSFDSNCIIAQRAYTLCYTPVDIVLKNKGFKLAYQQKGVPDASWSVCYDIFYEVWKK